MTAINEKYGKVVKLGQVQYRAAKAWRDAFIDEKQDSMRYLFTLLTTSEQRQWARIALRHAYQIGETLAEMGLAYSNYDPVPPEEKGA
ncbi:MAG: hypothetical protein U0990_01005 [Candidatus Nanopelagicales bacterium]|nr:hypothetical protein [Candidatus Nanopelagicales bacterium]